MKNLIVVDFDPAVSGEVQTYHEMIDIMSEESNKIWQFWGLGIKSRGIHTAERYLKYIRGGWKLFRDRKNIESILSMQQFYAIFYAAFCRLFNVKKENKVGVLSFIYRKRMGGGV